MDYNTPGLPVHHQFPEFTQTHVLWAADTIQPPHPLSFPSPPALSLSQHQGLSQWVGSLHHMACIGASASASVLPMNIQGWFPLGLTHLNSLQSKGLSRVFSNTTVHKHQFFSAQPSLWYISYIYTYIYLYIYTGKPAHLWLDRIKICVWPKAEVQITP